MNLFRLIAVFGLLLIPLVNYGQDEPRSVKKRKAQLEKQEKTKQKEAEKGKEAALDKHMRIQTKETQKRMKKNKKKSKRLNNNRKEFFIKRWFSVVGEERDILWVQLSDENHHGRPPV